MIETPYGPGLVIGINFVYGVKVMLASGYKCWFAWWEVRYQ